MAKEVVLNAEAREGRGKSAVRKLRAQGKLPGVVYGGEGEPVSLLVDRHELIRTLHAHGAHALVTLQVDGGEQLAIVKELQVDPVRLEALHVDFLRVQANKPVQTEVALELTGTPAGVKEGGILETQLTTLAIEALPRNLPESIGFDVAHLGLQDVARVGDITPPEGVTILTDPEETVATVSAPKAEPEGLAPEELAEGAEVAAAGVEEAPPEETGTEEG